MASSSDAPDQDEPAMHIPMHASIDRLLPTSVTKRSRSKSRIPYVETPKMEPPISSLTDSFMLDHKGMPSRASYVGLSEQNIPRRDDGPTPLSNWAHLAYVKEQRSLLRQEVEACKTASAKTNRAASSLRRLAFRMAANASTKEKRLAATAKNLAKNRMNHYVDGRYAEKRIEDLQKALQVEEEKTLDILEALERASMLTVQYSTPKAPLEHLHQNSLLTPPSSPPNRLVKSVTWHGVDSEHTPRSKIANKTRAFNARLASAKHQCDQALITCRSRIEDLQRECIQEKEEGRQLERTREALQDDIQSHLSRVERLEHSQRMVEETLAATKSRLDQATISGEALKQELEMKAVEVAAATQSKNEREETIQSVESELATLRDALQARNSELNNLKSNIASLEETQGSLQYDLRMSKNEETSLHKYIEEKDRACDDLEHRLQEEAQHYELLEERLNRYEAQAKQQSDDIQVNSNTISRLNQELKQSEDQKKEIEDSLVSLEANVSRLEADLQNENELRDKFVSELNSVKAARQAIERDLQSTQDCLKQEIREKSKLALEFADLRSSHQALRKDLEITKQHLHVSTIDADRKQAELERVQDAKTAMEADMKDSRQQLFKLSDDLRSANIELTDSRVSEANLQQKLERSKKHVADLSEQLDHSHQIMAEAEAAYERELHEKDLQIHHGEASLSQQRKLLKSSQELSASLKTQYLQAQLSKDNMQDQLTKVLEAHSAFQREMKDIQARLTTTQGDHDTLQIKVMDLELNISNNFQLRADLEAKLETSLAEADALKHTISQLEQSLGDSRNASAETEKALSDLETVKEASNTKIAKLHRQLSEEIGHKENVEDQLNEISSESRGLKEQLECSFSIFTAVESQAKEMQARSATLQEDVAQLQQLKVEAEAKLSVILASRSAIKCELQVAQIQTKDMEAEIKKLSSTISETEEELVTVHRSKSEAEKQLETVTRAHKSLQGQLNMVCQVKAETANRLDTALATNAKLDADLASSQSQIQGAQAQIAELTDTLFVKNKDLKDLRLRSAEADRRVEDATAYSTSLDQVLQSKDSELETALSQNAALKSEIDEDHRQLDTLSNDRAVLAKELGSAQNEISSLENDLFRAQMRLTTLETEMTTLLSRVSDAYIEVENWRSLNGQLEDQASTAIKLAADLNSQLLATREQLEASKSENMTLQSTYRQLQNKSEMALRRSQEAESNLHSLERHLEKIQLENASYSSKAVQTDEELKAAHKKTSRLEGQLAWAESDLTNVRDTNVRLEAFLERLENDMAIAEAAVESSEMCLEDFVKTSEAKLDHARVSKLKYKQKLSNQGHELIKLTGENDRLQHEVNHKTQELELLRKAKEEQALPADDGYDSGIDDTDEGSAKSLVFEDGEASQKNRQDLPPLDTKSIAGGSTSSRRGGFEIDRTAPSSPVTSCPPDSPLLHHSSLRGNHRPSTRGSTASHVDDAESLTVQLERMRNQRAAQSALLKSMKKERSDLKKSLKDSDAQVHRLEKAVTPTRRHTLLRKHKTSQSQHIRASTEPPAQPSPERPATSGGLLSTPESKRLSDNSIVDFITSSTSERPETADWTSPQRHKPFLRPKSSQMPSTNDAVKTSGEESKPVAEGAQESKDVETKKKKRGSLSRLLAQVF